MGSCLVAASGSRERQPREYSMHLADSVLEHLMYQFLLVGLAVEQRHRQTTCQRPTNCCCMSAAQPASLYSALGRAPAASSTARMRQAESANSVQPSDELFYLHPPTAARLQTKHHKATTQPQYSSSPPPSLEVPAGRSLPPCFQHSNGSAQGSVLQRGPMESAIEAHQGAMEKHRGGVGIF
jgi:hypothetical protein